jgi:hypothetical protein
MRHADPWAGFPSRRKTCQLPASFPAGLTIDASISRRRIGNGNYSSQATETRLSLILEKESRQ